MKVSWCAFSKHDNNLQTCDKVSNTHNKSYNQEFINIVCGEYFYIRIFDLSVWRDEYISVMTKQDSVTPVLRIMVKIMYD